MISLKCISCLVFITAASAHGDEDSFLISGGNGGGGGNSGGAGFASGGFQGGGFPGGAGYPGGAGFPGGAGYPGGSGFPGGGFPGSLPGGSVTVEAKKSNGGIFALMQKALGLEIDDEGIVPLHLEILGLNPNKKVKSNINFGGGK